MAPPDATLENARTLAAGDGAFASTVAAPSIAFASTIAATAADHEAILSLKKTQTGRTTVLPRVDVADGGPRLVAEAKTRYEDVKLLGKGGMGEVTLARDHDIARTVAVKRLLPEGERGTALLRFADEIRTIGRLEHPNIVPIHDVGVDHDGRYFFVMKHVEGETLESIIERLAAGDAKTHAHYTVERRVEIFLSLLRALEFSHANGIVHRDIKPANVMVGRFGEVVLMDWGIAKPVASAEPFADADTEDAASPRERVFKTRLGSLVGTPAYMSPEQARGEPVDERSDLYSAAVLFHELLSLKHYLADRTTLDQVVSGVLEREPPEASFAAYQHPHQPAPPADLMHFLHKALQKDPKKRFQSASEMILELHMIQDGRCRVQCVFTATKRSTREISRLVDRRPVIALGLVGTILVTFLAAIAALVIVAVRLRRPIA